MSTASVTCKRRTSAGFDVTPERYRAGVLLDQSHTALDARSHVEEFVAADQLAGRQICKMLSALFVYTLIAMSTAATWTYLATHQ